MLQIKTYIINPSYNKNAENKQKDCTFSTIMKIYKR